MATTTDPRPDADVAQIRGPRALGRSPTPRAAGRGQGAVPRHGDLPRHRHHADAGRPGQLAVPRRDLGDRRDPGGDLRDQARGAGEVPRARRPDADPLRGLPDRADRPDLHHQLRRRHPVDQGGGGRPDHRLLGQADRRTRRATTSASPPPGSKTSGPFTFFLVSQADGTVYKGTEDGLEELAEGDVTVAERPGHRRRRLHVPDREGGQRRRRRHQGLHGPDRQRRDPRARHHHGVRGHRRPCSTTTPPTPSPTPRPTRSTRVQRQGDREFFVDDDGDRVSDQSWKANVGAAQLQEGAHQRHDPRQVHQHLRLDVPVRDALGGLVLHPRAAAGDHPERRPAARAEDLSGPS